MTINVGLVGYGMSGSVFHAPIIIKIDGLQLTAVVSSDEGKVKRDYPCVKVLPDIGSLLACKEIDLVVISTPNTTHYDFTKQALTAGKHVVVEKPFTVAAWEADELIALAHEKKVLLTVYQNRRWDGDFLTVKKLLATNVLGKVSTYEAHFDRFRPEVRQRWREKDLPGSGILYDLGAHLIDQVLALFGKPKTVYADLRNEREGAQATDYFHLVLGYPELRVILHSGSLACKAGARFTLHGDKGSFVKDGLDPQEEQLCRGVRPGDPTWGLDQRENFGQLRTALGGLALTGTIETLPGGYEVFYEELVAAIQSAKPVPVLPEQARDTIRMIEYAMQSHQEQRTITIP
ncbi:oxidoreductase [Pelosinus sp. UFO1]|uniref:oxidoreductase n=1 Tax=Pelosinus sp. UFO1 TaxID=484770 RepID=UPI0004D0F794|nr:oxidoreductase [Pelosinus sp. UFO1]AIF52998.1 oxidoreductase domain protein [Pelosinus sp. UFO1]